MADRAALAGTGMVDHLFQRLQTFTVDCLKNIRLAEFQAVAEHSIDCGRDGRHAV
jgi:hypothetical protein